MSQYVCLILEKGTLQQKRVCKKMYVFSVVPILTSLLNYQKALEWPSFLQVWQRLPSEPHPFPAPLTPAPEALVLTANIRVEKQTSSMYDFNACVCDHYCIAVHLYVR